MIDAKTSKQVKEEAERIAAAVIARERRQQAAASNPRGVEDIPALNVAAMFETTAPAELLDPLLPFSDPSSFFCCKSVYDSEHDCGRYFINENALISFH